MRRTRFSLSAYLLSVAVGQCLVGCVIAAELPICTVQTDTSTFHTKATMVVTGRANERLYCIHATRTPVNPTPLRIASRQVTSSRVIRYRLATPVRVGVLSDITAGNATILAGWKRIA